jgi:riboflavin synthase
MFTGLVEALGTVTQRIVDGAGCTIIVQQPSLALELSIGESVAVNGTCLTVVRKDEQTFAFEAGPETLFRTNLGELLPGHRVNLERSLRFSDRLGGHLVQGHVDGKGSIDQRFEQGEWITMWFRCAPDLTAQMVTKGSIAVDGISLTVVDVEPERFSVALIPHTLAVTTLGFKDVGATVNLETDLLAKYVWKYLQLRPS